MAAATAATSTGARALRNGIKSHRRGRQSLPPDCAFASTRTPQQLSYLACSIPSRHPREDDDDADGEYKAGKVRHLRSIQTLKPPPLPFSINNNYGEMVRRSYHSTAAPERGAALVLGLGSLAAGAKAAQYGVRAYEEWKASQPEEPPVADEEKEQVGSKDEAGGGGQQRATEGAGGKAEEKTKESGKDAPRENIFAKLFNVGVGTKYYEGGFEDKMTRREAALILGVRESSTAKRIKEAHRKLLILNHPDTGGSTYMAGKINEAKELLLKGKRGG